MIFVIQVPPSKSEELIQRLKEVPFIKDAFSPLKKKKIKLRGYWEIREVRLFPDYIFVECDDPKDVYQELKDFSFFTKLLGVRDKKDNELYFIPLSEDEEAFLNHLMGKDNREVIGISKVMLLKNKQITIIDGPLYGMEGLVTKVDPHKQQVYVSLQLLGRDTTVALSVDLIKEL